MILTNASYEVFPEPEEKVDTKKDLVKNSAIVKNNRSRLTSNSESTLRTDVESWSESSDLSINATNKEALPSPLTSPSQYIRTADLNLKLEGDDVFNNGWVGIYALKHSNITRRKLVLSILDGMTNRALQMEKCSDLNKCGVPISWKPDSLTEKLSKANGCDLNLSGITPEEFHKFFGENFLAWQGSFSEKVFRDDLPIMKTRAIVFANPRDIAELILDSNRVKVYNQLSLGRTDEMILQSGIDTENGPYGAGETKVVRNLTRIPIPFINRSVEVVSLMHCRKLAPKSTGSAPGYIIITRAVNQEPNDVLASGCPERSRSEILISCNIVRSVRLPSGEIASDLTCMTHMNSPGVPMLMARSIAYRSGKNFVTDLRGALEKRGSFSFWG